MGDSEVAAVAASIVGGGLVQIADLQMYAGFRRVSLDAISQS